jgi:methanogenic corrinoid protein MtbC1
MTPLHTLEHCSTIPIYNTKAVAQETGVPSDTFRAWERRYGIIQPHRTSGGHRLYSEREIAIIRWLRDRTAEGMTISQAIALLQQSGEDNIISWKPVARDTEPYSWERLNNQLFAALMSFDEQRAEQVISEAFSLYRFDEVLEHLLRTTLVEIGEQWHAGKVSVAVEHFTSHLIRRKLLTILTSYNNNGNGGRGTILAGCAPGEQHDIGILLLAVALVRQGWHVIYLGAEVPLPDLLETIRIVRPALVCLSVSLQEHTQHLVTIGEEIAALPEPRPVFGFGGRAFNGDPSLSEPIAGIFLGTNIPQTLDTIARLV